MGQTKPPPFQNALVLGLGVIGGSVALGLKARGIARRVVGYALGSDVESAARAGAIDAAVEVTVENMPPNSSVELSLAQAIEQADLIVMALPVDVCISLLPLIALHLSSAAVLTDVCSVKQQIAKAVGDQLGPKAVQFVAAHPIAGSHLSGFEGATASLFDGATTVIAPSKYDAHQRITSLWQALGAKVCVMTNEQHDMHYSAVSHLPHMVAFALSNSVNHLSHQFPRPDIEQPAIQVGKGFLDTTRIAASSADLWAGIAMANREELLKSMDEFILQISTIRSCLELGDAEALKANFQLASDFRKQFDSKKT
jgi:prephenate dehydrogenase